MTSDTSPQPISPLRARMIEDMSVRGFKEDIRHYGLLASAACKANIARAKELIAAAMPVADPLAAHNTADPDATSDHRLQCPCCGGRMIIVEVFGRGGAPRGPPSGAGVRV